MALADGWFALEGTNPDEGGSGFTPTTEANFRSLGVPETSWRGAGVSGDYFVRNPSGGWGLRFSGPEGEGPNANPNYTPNWDNTISSQEGVSRRAAAEKASMGPFDKYAVPAMMALFSMGTSLAASGAAAGAELGAEGLVGAAEGGGMYSAAPDFLSTKDMLFPGLSSGSYGGYSAVPGSTHSIMSMLSQGMPSADFAPSGGNSMDFNGGGDTSSPFASNTFLEGLPNLDFLSQNAGGGFGNPSFNALDSSSYFGGGSGAAGGGDWMDMLKKIYSQTKPYRGAFDVARGVKGYMDSRAYGKMAQPGRNAAAQMQALMNNPDMVTNLPGYAGMAKAREQAVARRMAAAGYNMSGNEKMAIADSGAELFQQYRNTELDRLGRIAGTQMAPQMAQTQLQGNSVNSILQGLMKLVG